MAQPRWEYVLWEQETVLHSATAGEVFVCGRPLHIADWANLVVQFDTIEASAGQADGTFQCTVEDTVAMGDFESWREASYADMSGSHGAVVFDSIQFGPNELRAWTRWKIRHNVAGSHWMRVQVKALLKGRASPEAAADAAASLLADAARMLRQGGVGFAALRAVLDAPPRS